MQKLITEHAAVLRLNRKLAKDGLRVYRTKENSRLRGDLGRFYIVEVAYNRIDCQDIDLIAWMREAGALQPWESVDLS